MLGDEGGGTEGIQSFQDLYFDLIGRGRRLTTFTNIQISNLEQTLAASIQTTPTSSRSQLNVKLSSINMSNFDGNATKWLEFLDIFKTVVDSNELISKAQRMCYLKSALQGEAAAVLASFATTDSNYDVPFEVLQGRFSNQRRIVQSHVRKLWELESTQGGSHGSLRNIIDKIEQHMRCLESLNVPVHTWDAIIVPIVLAKLDYLTVKEWEIRINEGVDSR